jgi:hypothetical protein
MAIADKYITTAQLAELTGISARTLHDRMNKGKKIDGVKSYEKLHGYRSSPYMIKIDEKYFKKR